MSSLLTAVAERRRQRLSAHHLDLPIQQAGWDGELVARFRVRDKESWGSTEYDADVLAMACEVVLLRNGKTGELEELRDDAGAFVGFDPRLAEKLGVPRITQPRDIVRYVFSEEDGTVNDLAISDMAVVVKRWTAGRTLQAEAALLGGK